MRKALKAWASLCLRAYCRVTGRQVEAVDDLARAAGLEVRGSDGAEHRREAASEDRTSAEKAQAAALDAIVNLLFDDDGPRSSASTAGAPVQSPG